jgi:hypothetical protein
MIVRRPVQWRFQHSFFCSSDLWRKNISFLIALYCAACICSSFITYASKAPHYCASDFPFEGLHATIFNSWTNPTLLFLFADSLSTFYFKLRVDHFFVVLLEHISLLWQTPSIFFSNEASCESRWTSWLRDLYEDFNIAFVWFDLWKKKYIFSDAPSVHAYAAHISSLQHFLIHTIVPATLNMPACPLYSLGNH